MCCVPEFFSISANRFASRRHRHSQTEFGNEERGCVTSVRKPPPKTSLEPKPKKGLLDDDVLKVSKMPDLAIEVLSPSQTINELLKKFSAFFALDIKSCWLVMPSVEVIKVYSQQGSYKTFDMNDTEVIDEILDVHLPIQKIFDFEDWVLTV